MNKNFFCCILLIILVSLTNKLSAQFVPFQSGQFKHLAADTLYNLTGCGVPATTPNSYKRIVDYYDSCAHKKYYWQPENQVWSELVSSDSASFASLSFGHGLLIFDENPYNPIGDNKVVALDTALINSYIDSIIAIDTSIGQIINNPAFIVKYKSNAPVGGDANGDKYLVDVSPTGTFTGHANQVATKVGGSYTYATPSQGDQLILDNPITPTYAGYQFNGTTWQPTNIIVLAGGNSGIGSLQIGTRDSKDALIKTKNITALSVDTLQNVYLPKYTGLEDNNLFFKPGLNGKIDTGHFSAFAPGTNITFTPVGDTTFINSSGGGAFFGLNDTLATTIRHFNLNDSYDFAFLNGIVKFLAGSNQGVFIDKPINAGHEQKIELDQEHNTIIQTAWNSDAGGGIKRDANGKETLYSDSLATHGGVVSLQTHGTDKLSIDDAGNITVATTAPGTAGADSVMVKTIGGVIKAISPTYYGTGGGGGGSSLFPTAGGSTTLLADGTADLNGKILTAKSAGTGLAIDGTADNENTDLTARNVSNPNTVSRFSASTNPTNSNSSIYTSFNDDEKFIRITGFADAAEGSLTYTADTHTFNGNTVFANNGTPALGKVPTGTDADGNWTWQTPSGGGGTTLTRQVITSGSSATVTGSNYIVNIDPASTLASYTLTLPATPTDLETVEVDFGGTLTSGVIVTALTISANSGQTILDNTPPVSATADNTILYRYRASNTTWYRFKP